MIRYYYTDGEGYPIFRAHYSGTIGFFEDEKAYEIESQGWKIVKYGYCLDKSIPDRKIRWIYCK